MKRRWLIIALAITIIIKLITPFPTKAAELNEIQQRGQLIVAVKDNLRPLGFRDKEGNLVGLEIDIARKLAAEILGDANAIVFKPVSNQTRLKVILDHQADIAIAKVTNTASRRRIVNFSPHYYLDGTGIITKNININSVKDLGGAKIAVLYNSATIAVIRARQPQAQLVGVNSYQEALQLLEAEEVAAFTADITTLTGWIQQYPEYKLLPERLSGEPLCIVMPKGLQYEELRSKVYQTLLSWRKSGWLQERITYYHLP
ncbi:MAG: transporter substrate-binding domain-containing protein [Xenococcaceae cyanobacterium MO_167.B27]|nr:transporter substrate-binding domain-containing protein [Xenococcaceae cyanobacterium MO_167.B27]